MVRRGASLCLLLLLVVTAAACSDDKKAGVAANPLVLPTNYKSEIIATLRDLFEKNATIRVSNALVSDPVVKLVGTSQLYTVCVRYTAHGVSADYVGNAERIGYFYAGHLNQLVPTEKDECAGAAYKPFPELNQFCIGKGCR
jgi:hypothetical protein